MTQATPSGAQRLAAVKATGLLDAPAEESFDRLTRLAAKLTGAPVTFISLVDENRDFYVSCFGFPEPLATTRQLEGTTFCHYAIRSTEPLVIPDTKADPVYSQVPTVQSLGVSAYLGIPLTTTDGVILGSFCAIDFQPREWRPIDVEVMQELAASTMREIELRRAIEATKDAEAEAAAERGRLSALLEHVPAGVLYAEAPSGKIVLGNKRVEEILGHPVLPSASVEHYDEWIGFHPDGRRVLGHEWPLARALRGETVPGQDFLYQRGDGRLSWIRVQGAPVFDEHKQIIGSVIALYDIDASRRLALENEALLETARRANAAKDEFFAAVTHELRTPMTAIIGWSRLLQAEAMDNPDAVEAAQMIESSARMQARLVDDLLDIARIAAGKIGLHREPVRIEELAAEAVRAAEPAARGQGIRLRLEGSEVSPIQADRARLRQVLGNLLSNAIKFTPSGGLVEVDTRNDNGHVILQVRDSGRGIAPELLPHIFERGTQERNAEKGGLGLGLTIVRHLVELHGGSVQAESEGEGKGSQFTVRLPVG